MIRFLLASSAYILLAAAFAVGVIDTTRSVQARKLVVIPVEHVAAALLSTQLGAYETVAKAHVPGFLWDPVAGTLLHLPAFAILGALASVLFYLARQRPKKLTFPAR